MPRREDIEKFAQVLNSLGDEPAIRAARSETIEEVPTAGEEAPAGPPAGELDTLDLGPESGTEPGGAGSAEAESLQDIFASLADLPGETAPEEGPAPGGEAAPAAAPGSQEEGLDFASLFGEESTPGPIEDLEQPAPRAPSPPAAAAPAEEDVFSFPGGEPEGMQADLAQMETLPEEGPTGESGGPSDLGAPDLGDLAGLESMADLGGEPAEPGAEPSMEPGAEPGGGPLEDLGALASPEASFEEPSGGLETPGAEPAAEESFDLPSLDDLTFGEPGAAPAETGETAFDLPASEAAPAAEEEAPSFDLDTASFAAPSPEAPTGAGEELGGEAAEGPFSMEPPTGTEPSAEAPAAGLEGLAEGDEGLADLNLDQFSLPESAGQFGMPGEGGGEPFAMPAAAEEEPPAAPPPRPRRPERKARAEARPAPAAAEPPELGGAEGEIELTPEQFAPLKRTLESLPRNLKVAVQDLIGEGTAAGPDLSALLGLLVRGAGAQEIATLAGRISGKRIRIPAGYEKKSGMALEAEQRTFGYAFRENFFPLIRTVGITVLAGALFGFLGYNYIYRPLSAIANYRAGYAQIANDRFAIANERFRRATSVWPMKDWYYRYAEGFAGRRAYQLAEQKYEELLKAWPGDKRGTLDYARLETTRLADYTKADGLLKGYLDTHLYDYDALLASGDNYLAWAERDRTRYEAARLAYATLIDRYGAKDELLFRMLRYFIRTDNAEEVERLRAYYTARPEEKIDPDAYAEMGGYLIDHRRLEYAQDVLLRADGVRHGILEVHYNLARYFRLVQDPDDEKKALDATKQILDLTRNTEPLTVRRLGMEIDTHTRLGEYYYHRRQYLPAQTELQEAVRLVETNQRMGLIDKGPLYGRPYAALGDLSYYVEGNLQNAAQQFQAAAANGFTTTLLTYKIGYVQYMQGDYKNALATFAAAEDASAYPSSVDLLGPEALPAGQQIASPPPRGASAAPGSPGSSESSTPAAAPTASTTPINPAGQPPQNLLYALGNAFYQRGDYFAAQASYLRLRDRLETRRAAAGILHPEDRPEDRAFLDTIVKVDTNLGVTMFRLGEKTADRRKKSEALVYLSAANEIASELARSPDTVRRSEERPLPALNMRGILYPVSGFVLQIYSDLPKDFQAADW